MFKSIFLRWQLIASIAACFVSMAGCAGGSDSAWRQRAVPDPILPARHIDVAAGEWWELFNDPLLTQLQSGALEGNLDLQIAAERIEQGRARLGIVSSQLLPSVAVGSSYAREALSENGKFAALGAPSAHSGFWQIAFDSSWEIDLWGRARSAREGAAASLAATVYDQESARVALAAEVARTYLQLRGVQAQLDIARQNQALAEHTLGLAESRERNGVATRFETSSARAQLATIRATIPELTQRADALMNALALQLGQEPRTLEERLRDTVPLPSLPTEVPVGIPSELARMRPDVLRAEAQLHAATAAVAVAEADFYPRIALRGRVGVEAFESGDLDKWDSRFFSIGPTIHLPIFQGGRLTQRLALHESRQKEAALTYRQTVLRAWHEVENALGAWDAQQQEHAALQIAYEQNTQALNAAERGYEEGVADYLSVLTAQRSILASQTSLNNSATSAGLALVNLYKSLGGGWHPQAPETALVSSTVSVAE